ncbi:MAG: Mur ligase family protein [Nitrospirota bacterium]
MIIINADDNDLGICHFDKPIRFSIYTDSEYQAKATEYQPFKTIFKVHSVSFKLSLPGKYNLYNALSCIALLSEMGTALKDIAEVLPDFSGLDRRFDIYLNNGKNLVIDDYAHNPYKISCFDGIHKKNPG